MTSKYMPLPDQLCPDYTTKKPGFACFAAGAELWLMAERFTPVARQVR